MEEITPTTKMIIGLNVAIVVSVMMMWMAYLLPDQRMLIISGILNWWVMIFTFYFTGKRNQEELKKMIPTKEEVGEYMRQNPIKKVK